MRNDSDGERCRDLLPEYVAGTLSATDRAAVERHLLTCGACAHELAQWESLAGSVRDVSAATTPMLPLTDSWDLLAGRLAQPLPDAATSASPTPVERSLETPAPEVYRARAARDLAALVAPANHVRQVLGGQARLMRPAVWIASALGIALAVLYAFALPRAVAAQDVLALALPLIAATGIAFLYGPDVDAGLELALASPTSPRLVLLSRFALLFGYDTALALAGTLALTIFQHGEFAPLAAVWFGPMALLSTLSLALSLVLGPAVAIGGAAALWLARTLRLDDGFALHVSAGAFWPTTPQVLAFSLALLAFALLYVPRQERLRPDSET